MEINPATEAYLSHMQGISPTSTNKNINTDSKANFGELLREKLNKVNELQVQGDVANQQLVTGEAKDLHSVLLTTAEARLALEMTVQVRNKLIDAYQTINNMQL